MKRMKKKIIIKINELISGGGEGVAYNWDEKSVSDLMGL